MARSASVLRTCQVSGATLRARMASLVQALSSRYRSASICCRRVRDVRSCDRSQAKSSSTRLDQAQRRRYSPRRCRMRSASSLERAGGRAMGLRLRFGNLRGWDRRPARGSRPPGRSRPDSTSSRSFMGGPHATRMPLLCERRSAPARARREAWAAAVRGSARSAATGRSVSGRSAEWDARARAGEPRVLGEASALGRAGSDRRGPDLHPTTPRRKKGGAGVGVGSGYPADGVRNGKVGRRRKADRTDPVARSALRTARERSSRAQSPQDPCPSRKHARRGPSSGQRRPFVERFVLRS